MLRRDRAARYRFAPLDGERARELIAAAREAGRVPPDLDRVDSILVVTPEGRVLARSEAVLAIAADLGGFWRALGAVARVLPRRVRDLVYDGVAAVRYRVFGRKEEACPLLPPDLRARFDL